MKPSPVAQTLRVVHRRALFLISALLSFSGQHDAMTTPLSISMASSSSSVPNTHGASSSVTSCAVVGVGVLGTSLCQQLLEQEGCFNSVSGITKTTSRHDQIRAQLSSLSSSTQFKLQTADDTLKQEQQFDSVVFCAPPSGFDDYPGAIRQAAKQLWNKKGVFVFTSSGAVYGSGDGEMAVTEASPTGDGGNNPRIDRMLQAEQACLEAGGCCLRLAGLYNLQRGAHNFWLTKSSPVMGSAHGMVNLLHYDDAASACLAAICAGPELTRGEIFLVSDGHPMSRQDICASALQAKVYQSCSMPTFEDNPTVGLGKLYDGSYTNERLRWKPAYESFDAFMKSHS